MEKDVYAFVGKSHYETEEYWLPLWMHHKDTAGIMKKLVGSWAPESVIDAAGLKYKTFRKIAVFLAALHDIGKAASYFQNMVTKSLPEKKSSLEALGFCIPGTGYAEGKTPHAQAGQWILLSEENGFAVPEELALIVGAHHGKPDGWMDADLLQVYPVNFFGTEDARARKLWRSVWRDIVNQAMELAGISDLRELPQVTLRGQVLISGLLIAADWLASNTFYFPLIPSEELGSGEFYPGRIQEAWKKAAFPEIWCSQTNQMDGEMFKKRFGFPPNEVQDSMLKVVNQCRNPGIIILEAGMGAGKTEAAFSGAEVLAAQRHAGGVFFGLPTQATSNGMFGRMYAWADQVSEETINGIDLAHGAAGFQEEYRSLLGNGCSYVNEEERGGLEVHPWFQGSKKALLSDFVIGTVDQFLLASLKRKHFMLRHIGLAGKVVIIDEVHAYDAYMAQYLERSLEWMAAYGVPVILLSATLPAKRRQALAECYVKAYSKYGLGKRKPDVTYERTGWEKSSAYPLLTWTDGEKVCQEEIRQVSERKTVKIGKLSSVSQMTAMLGERLAEGGCACIIANTVRAAQHIYEECQRDIKNAELILYHAQFAMPDRVKKEEELLRRMGKDSDNRDRNQLILIGTQVLEQSLDYDVDIMVTQLCPIDLLLQRIGRLHRHKREGYLRPDRLKEPECMILQDRERAYDDGSKAVYGDYLLMRTGQILESTIVIPKDIPELVQRVYEPEDNLGLEGEKYEKAVEAYRKTMRDKEEKAGHYRLMEPKNKKKIDDLLVNPEGSSEKIAEASVRDGVSSIEVLLMKRNGDGSIGFVTEGFQEEPPLSPQRVPDSEEGWKIARQRLRLPHLFSKLWNLSDSIHELEERNRKELAQWQESPWLRGELILLLDETGSTELGTYMLAYDYQKGLVCERKEEGDE